jgi:serine phosphatase RsbU (regulator of sigma subunit)
MFPRAKFTMHCTQLEPGDALVIFSDGVTEAQNTTRDLFGDSRLKDLLE